MMFRVTVYAGPSETDDRPSSVAQYEVSHDDLGEKLRHIGLEWKTADYMPQRQVIIAINPIPAHEQTMTHVRAKVREAAIALEETWIT